MGVAHGPLRRRHSGKGRAVPERTPVNPKPIQIGRRRFQYNSEEKEVSHQLSGEPKMRFVSTALVMMAIALMLLALMLLTPTVRANPMTFGANLTGHEYPLTILQTTGSEL